MVSLDEFKKALGAYGEQLSNEEIIKVRDMLERVADATFDMWLEKKNIDRLPKPLEDL